MRLALVPAAAIALGIALAAPGVAPAAQPGLSYPTNPPPTVQWREEGGYRGLSSVVNCSGAGVTCSVVGGVARVAVPAGAGAIPGACSSGQALTSTGTALQCTSTLKASDVVCSGTCVSDAEIAGVSGAKVSGTVPSATSCSSCTSAASATTATSATTAATATNLTCSGECVGDAEISGVSGGKVDGPVRFAETLAVASRPFRLTAGGWTGSDWLSAEVSSVELGMETAVAIHCYVPYQMDGFNAGIGLRFTGPAAAAFFATAVCEFHNGTVAASTVTSLGAELAPLPDGTDASTVLGCSVHASFISANENTAPLVLEYRSANGGAAAARVEAGAWCTYLQ